MSTPPAIQWLLAGNPPGHKRPEWERSACIDQAGVVYAPAALTGNELQALLCASWDGAVAAVESDGHVYLPVQWLAAYRPADADLFLLIERRVREHFGKGAAHAAPPPA